MTDEPKKYLYEPSTDDIHSRARQIRLQRMRELRESTYVAPHEDLDRVIKFVLLSKGRPFIFK